MPSGLRKLYHLGYRRSPKFLKSFLGKATFKLAAKPFVQKPYVFTSAKFPRGFRGGLIISADFEMGWAFRFSKTEPHPLEKARQTRRNFPELLKMLADYDVPATWATVGHLFLRGCRKGDHDWMHPIPYFENRFWSYRSGGWFDCDPYTSWEKAKEWYAPDLIEAILQSRTRHEIGCHSFSHADFTYEHCPREAAEDEIKACLVAAKEWSLDLKSFVFPAGTYGHFEALKKFGFSSYRQSLDYELAYPYWDRFGLLVLPSARGLEDNGLGWSAPYWIRRFQTYIDKAVATQTLCHFWFHPSLDSRFLQNVFPFVLRYAADKREKGDLWIGSMQSLTEHVRKAVNEKA